MRHFGILDFIGHLNQTGSRKTLRTGKIFGAICLALTAGLASFATSARADSLQDEVMNDEGTVYNTFAWQVTSGTLASGTFTIEGTALQDEDPAFFSPADGFDNTFTYPTTVDTGTVAGTQNITDVVDPTANDNPGVIGINVDASDPSNDYLVEEIDLGYGDDQPENLQPLFLSTKLLGFGLSSGDVYWLAFQGGPATSFSPAGAIIGGLIEDTVGGDIKAFDVVPLPPAAYGVLVMMLILGGSRLGGWMSQRRLQLSTTL